MDIWASAILSGPDTYACGGPGERTDAAVIGGQNVRGEKRPADTALARVAGRAAARAHVR